MAEFDISVELMAPATIDDETLERDMLDVLRVAETHGNRIALGPVVALNFEKRSIDLGFNVEAQTPAESQRLVGELLELLEEHSEVRFADSAVRSCSPVHPEPLAVA